MSSRFCQFLVFSCLTVTLLMGRVMTSPEVRQRRSDDGGPLETVVEQLSQQVSSLNAQLTQQANSFNAQLTQLANSLNAQLTSVNAELAALKTKTATLDETVVFQAWMSHNALQVLAGGTIILSDVAINVGNAYDKLTGVFTVPVSGIYSFQATIMSDKRGSGQYAFGGIYVDGSHRVAGAFSDSEHGYWVQATMNYMGHLSAGQKILLRNQGSVTATYHGSPKDPYTSFSGFLVKAD